MQTRSDVDRNALVVFYLPRLERAAAKYGELSEEMVQTGAMALMDAIERFETGTKAQPWTFLFRRVRGAFIDYFRSCGDESRALRTYKPQFDLLREKLGYTPSIEQVCADLHCHADTARSLLADTWVISTEHVVATNSEGRSQRVADMLRDEYAGSERRSAA